MTNVIQNISVRCGDDASAITLDQCEAFALIGRNPTYSTRGRPALKRIALEVDSSELSRLHRFC